MEVNLRGVVMGALQQCRIAGVKADAVELAYHACLMEEQGSWGSWAAQAATDSSSPASPDTQSQQALSLHSGTQLLSDAAIKVLVEKLAQHMVQQQGTATAATARLQIALERSCKEQQDGVEAKQTQQAAEAARLAAAVAYKKVHLRTANLPQYQAVFDAVLDYVCSAMGVGARAAADAAIRVHISAAVESAFPLAGIAHFLTLSAQERLQQMETLARVVDGICLFNASTGTAPPLMPASAAAQLPQAQRLLAAITKAAAEAEQALDYYNTVANISGTNTTDPIDPYDCYIGSGSGSSSGDSGSRGGVTSLGVALYCCQAVVALRRLAADLAAGINCCQALDDGITAALTQAGQLVAGGSAAVSKEAVFPLFESAGRLHLALTGELRLLLVHARLWEASCAALTQAVTAATAAGHGISSSSRQAAELVPNIIGFKGRLGKQGHNTAGQDIASAMAAMSLPPGMEYIPPDAVGYAATPAAATPGVEGIEAAAGGSDAGFWAAVALSGCCPVSLGSSAVGGNAAAGHWLGQLASPSLGCIRYHEALYGFSSPAALQTFIQSPEQAVAAIRKAVHKAPLLAYLLGLTNSAAAGAAASQRPSNRGLTSDPMMQQPVAVPHLRQLLLLMEAPMKLDAGTQTPTHFLECNIDVNYEWNEWALRRRIIALANLRNKATHSAQTLLSHFRREGETQTWQPKTSAVQTPVNSSTTMPRKLRCVTGLRGAPETAKMKVVSLELDIGQTHQH